MSRKYQIWRFGRNMLNSERRQSDKDARGVCSSVSSTRGSYDSSQGLSESHGINQDGAVIFGTSKSFLAVPFECQLPRGDAGQLGRPPRGVARCWLRAAVLRPLLVELHGVGHGLGASALLSAESRQFAENPKGDPHDPRELGV